MSSHGCIQASKHMIHRCLLLLPVLSELKLLLSRFSSLEHAPADDPWLPYTSVGTVPCFTAGAT
jgi:hypothetical protein